MNNKSPLIVSPGLRHQSPSAILKSLALRVGGTDELAQNSDSDERMWLTTL
ncbi:MULTISPECIES: hypothetical protein [Yersinia pseudotuberculosis complex]|uniref:hypothetical protein n=1 Tax=Yersinia pseudotuberculosis complex TaxID=1649845 RepID=UPI0004BC68B2|nr:MULTISPECIES: hypothetical protein [Yersinia pseudotuberculosis complex]